MQHVITSSHQSTAFTVKCDWSAGGKILKLVKRYNPLFAYTTKFHEIEFAIREMNDDNKQEMYKFLLQNNAKEIRMVSGLSILD
jgi:hypothetical protein